MCEFVYLFIVVAVVKCCLCWPSIEIWYYLTTFRYIMSLTSYLQYIKYLDFSVVAHKYPFSVGNCNELMKHSAPLIYAFQFYAINKQKKL